MTSPRRRSRDPLERALESALAPGRFIPYGAGSDFVSGLEKVAGQIQKLIRMEATRAVRLYQTFLGGCYEKADEIDDSSGSFGTFVGGLYSGWIRARRAAMAGPEETARLLLGRMDDDPYGFCQQLERTAVKVMDKNGLAAFERQVRGRFEGEAGSGSARRGDGSYERRRWGEVLRVIYVEQRNVKGYVELCERTELTPQDCHTIAILLRARSKPEDALTWVERGLELEKMHPRGTMAGHALGETKRQLLAKLGRRGDALASAWEEFQKHPDEFSYAELMRYVPKAERVAWHAKAMETAEHADLRSLIPLWLATDETERLVRHLRDASDHALESLGHHTTEPAAKRLARTHADVAARVYRALGMRILDAKKSRYYDAALSHFEDAKHCYERADLHREWEAVVAEVRRAHQRKVGFMPNFERLVAGAGPSSAPSFLERARRRWLDRGGA